MLETNRCLLCGLQETHKHIVLEKLWNFQCFVRFDVLMATTIKNAVFRDVTPCGSCKNRSVEGAYPLAHRFLSP
jgi:hypothetical protein